MRVVATLINLVTILVAARGATDADQPIALRVMFFILATGTAAMAIVTWKRWLRNDQLDELAGHVERQGGAGSQHVVWLLAYENLSTPTIRRVNGWLRTHDLRLVPPADMPDEIKYLHQILEKLEHGL